MDGNADKTEGVVSNCSWWQSPDSEMFTELSHRAALHQCPIETYWPHHMYPSDGFGEAVTFYSCLVRILARSPDILTDFIFLWFHSIPVDEIMVTFEAIHHKSIKHMHICFYSSMTACFGQVPSQNFQNKAKYSANKIHIIFCPFLNVLLSKNKYGCGWRIALKVSKKKKQSRMFSIKLNFWLVPLSWIIHFWNVFQFITESSKQWVQHSLGHCQGDKIIHYSPSMKAVCFCEK